MKEIGYTSSFHENYKPIFEEGMFAIKEFSEEPIERLSDMWLIKMRDFSFDSISAYLLLIVIFTSDFMKQIGRSFWKKTHYLEFPIWILSAVHGLFLGTDSQTLWAEILFLSTTLTVVLSTLYLVVLMNKKKLGNVGARQ